jgi:transcriptional regulator with XRE-family HTH domain
MSFTMKKKVSPKVVGERLRQLRGCRTKTGVSRETGIPYSSLCAYESGERNPKPEVRKIMAEYYGVSEESIFYTCD